MDVGDILLRTVMPLRYNSQLVFKGSRRRQQVRPAITPFLSFLVLRDTRFVGHSEHFHSVSVANEMFLQRKFCPALMFNHGVQCKVSECEFVVSTVGAVHRTVDH